MLYELGELCFIKGQRHPAVAETIIYLAHESRFEGRRIGGEKTSPISQSMNTVIIQLTPLLYYYVITSLVRQWFSLLCRGSRFLIVPLLSLQALLQSQIFLYLSCHLWQCNQYLEDPNRYHLSILIKLDVWSHDPHRNVLLWPMCFAAVRIGSEDTS